MSIINNKHCFFYLFFIIGNPSRHFVYITIKVVRCSSCIVFEANASTHIYMVRPFTVKKIRVQFSIRFNLVWKLMFNFISLDNNSYSQKKKDNHWSTKHFPHSDIFFHRKQKSVFYFWTLNVYNFQSGSI
jgi:hypothetical protein